MTTTGTAFTQQDPMFTRYMFISNMMYNPASIANTDQTKMMAFYRNQWAGIQGAPVTMGLAVELPLNSSAAGLGFNIFQDKIGFETHTALYCNYAYRIPVSDSYTLSTGLKGGLSIYRANLTDAVTPDPSLSDPVFVSQAQSIVPRVGFGIFLSSDKNYVGMAIPAIVAFIPRSGFSFSDDGAFLSRHFYLTAGRVIDFANKDIQVKPSVFVKYHPSAPIQIDCAAQMWYKDVFSFGLTYRTGDAIAGIFEIAINKEMILSYAYDYTFSDFRKIAQGAHEVILTYQLKKREINIPSIHKFKILPRF
jgi:type IX secretion system PorP/SprF family membrane protein